MTAPDPLPPANGARSPVAIVADAHPLARYPLLRKHAIVTADDHAREAAKRLDFEWEGIATAANIVALVGHPGAGKTTLFYLMLAARRNRTGKPIAILGRNMKPAPRDKLIVLIQEEVGLTPSEKKLARCVAALGLPPETTDGVVTLARKNATFGSDLWVEIERLVRDGMVDSIWCDSLARMNVGVGTDSDSEEDQAKLFGAIADVLESSPDPKPILWTTAHARKGAAGESITDMSGSTQRGAQVDAALWVELVEEDHQPVGSQAWFLKTRHADDVRPAPCTLTLSNGLAKWSTSDGEIGGKAFTEDVLLGVFEAGLGYTESRLRILVMQARGAVPTKSKEPPKADLKKTRAFLASLEGKGKVSRCKIKPRRGEPFDGWRLGAEGGEVDGVHLDDAGRGAEFADL